MSMTTTFKMWVDAKDHAKAKRLAKRLGMSVADLYRVAMGEYLHWNETAVRRPPPQEPKP